jgi:hypothetical protein
VLVYLLIVVNFQSWTDPFIIITALPAALAGIVLFLFLTRTTLSVPASDGRHYVHGRGYGQQHPCGFVCHRFVSMSTATLCARLLRRVPRASAPSS